MSMQILIAEGWIATPLMAPGQVFVASLLLTTAVLA